MTSDETLPPRRSGDSFLPGSADSHLPRPEEVVLGRYRIGRELGRGGQAIVFEARDMELDRLVALKVLTPTLAGGGDWQGLLEEARLQAAVEVPGVARLLDALRDGERRYLVMELVRGPGLKEVIAELRDRRRSDGTRPKNGGWLAQAAGLSEGTAQRTALEHRSWDRAIGEFGAYLADSVGRLHERGLIHRDLKPGNIKLDSMGRPVVLDFGLARWLDAPTSDQLQGTPGYMAPEQLESGQEQHDARTDVYQIGLILYEMLTLERAYPADAVREIARYVQLARAGLVRAVRDVDSRADVGLAAVIGRALAPKPEGRYARLADLSADLRRVAAGGAPRLTPTPLGYRARCAAKAAARGPAGVALLAAAILIPVVWTVRAGFLQTVTSVEGWRFSPETSDQLDVVSDSLVHVGDDLGIRVSTSKPTIIYVLSIYGGDRDNQRLVKPMPPTPLVNGVPQASPDTRWGTRLEAGTHELICTRIEESNQREGLLVFATPERLETLERWLESLDERSALMGFGVEQELAFALLDEIREPVGARGGAVLAAGPGESASRIEHERERYSGLSASKAAGREEWDLGQGLIRYEVMCKVVPK